MSIYSKHYTKLAWIALLAFTFSAFAPSISKILLRFQSNSWVEVCTVQGSKWVSIRADNTSGAPNPDIPLMMSDKHCAYCVLQPHDPFIPPTSIGWDVLPLASDRLRVGSSGTTIFKRFVRYAHHTRAPPVFS
jgi:hypothetical protein